jgi:phosphatidate cytidylyltransferase
MKNSVQRALTATVIFIAMTGAVILSSYLFLILFFILNILGLNEFYRLFHSAAITPRKTGGLILSAFLFITSWLFASGISDLRILLVNIPFSFLIFIRELYLRAEKPFENLAFTFLGIIYITLPLVLFVAAAYLPAVSGMYHPHIILGCLFIIWSHDTAAYFTGKSLGRHPLFKRLSPHKTLEGSAGGIFFAAVVVYINSRWFPEMDWNHWAALALIIIVTGTLGDLVKSMMKRSLDIKDSGTILPGHGGILDRFDSLLGSAPFIFLYLVLVFKM